jgi:hypothetical protein
VAGARVYLDGAPTDPPPLLPAPFWSAPDAQTDAAGTFRAPAYSPSPPGVLELRVAVTRPGVADTVRLSAGRVAFRIDRERPDTVRVALRLP